MLWRSRPDVQLKQSSGLFLKKQEYIQTKKIVRIVTIIHLPIVIAFLHATHSKHIIRNRPSRFFVAITPFHTFPQPWHFVWRMSEYRIWFWIIVYPSMGKFSSDLVWFGTSFIFLFFSSFSFDGSDWRTEVAVVIAARASIFDVTELADFAANCFWRANFFAENCWEHLTWENFVYILALLSITYRFTFFLFAIDFQSLLPLETIG